jgi:hypothetical protein
MSTGAIMSQPRGGGAFAAGNGGGGAGGPVSAPSTIRGRGRGFATRRASASRGRVRMASPLGRQAMKNSVEAPMSNGFNNSSTPTTFGSAPMQRPRSDQPQHQYKPQPFRVMNADKSSFEQMKKAREKDRTDAISKGLIDDPDKPKRLDQAITFVGTCYDMCPAFERVGRIVQNGVDSNEKEPTEMTGTPVQEKMVKEYRRSAAGNEAPLPSDVRPPKILQRTLQYLMNNVLGGHRQLPRTHKFLWSRTRSIRQDFTFQNVSRATDLLIAIDCFEQIARFHILSLHLMSDPLLGDEGFSHQQEREQLYKTLTSLMYFYDDCRAKHTIPPREAEFRAYYIIAHITDQDIERQAQLWPKDVLAHRSVQTALALYAAAQNIHDSHGTLRASEAEIGQNFYGRFWRIMQTNKVSYLMGCLAETHFNRVRKLALTAIRQGYRVPQEIPDWSLHDLQIAMGYDSQEEVQAFCEAYGLTIGQRSDDGSGFLLLNSVAGALQEPSPPLPQRMSRRIVEVKRHNRSLPSIVAGLTVSQARAQGQLLPNSTAVTFPNQTSGASLFVQDEARGRASQSDHTNLIPTNPFSANASPFSSRQASPSPFAPAIAPMGPQSADGFNAATTNQFPSATINAPAHANTSPFAFGSTSVPGPTVSAAPVFNFGGSQSPSNPASQTTQSPMFQFGNPAPQTALKPEFQNAGGFGTKPGIAPNASPTFIIGKQTNTLSSHSDPFKPSGVPTLSPVFKFDAPTPIAKLAEPVATITANSTAPAVSQQQSLATAGASKFSSPLSKESNLMPQKPPFSFLAPSAPEEVDLASTGLPSISEPQLTPNFSSPTPNLAPALTPFAGSSLPSSQNQFQAAPMFPVPSTTTPGKSLFERMASTSNELRSNQTPLTNAEDSVKPKYPSQFDFGSTSSKIPAITPTATASASTPLQQTGPIQSTTPQSSPSKALLRISPERSEPLPIPYDFAEWVTLGQGGLLEQFIEHNWSVFEHQARRKIEDEQAISKATAFRERILMERYFYRWRDRAYQSRLRRRGRKIRGRTRASSSISEVHWTPVVYESKAGANPEDVLFEAIQAKKQIYKALPILDIFGDVVNQAMLESSMPNENWALSFYCNDEKADYWWQHKFGLYNARDLAGSIVSHKFGTSTLIAYTKSPEQSIMQSTAFIVFGCSVEFDIPADLRFEHDAENLHKHVNRVVEVSKFENIILLVVCYRSPLDNKGLSYNEVDTERQSAQGRKNRKNAIMRALHFSELPQNIIGREVILVETREDLDFRPSFRKLTRLVLPTVNPMLAKLRALELNQLEIKKRDSASINGAESEVSRLKRTKIEDSMSVDTRLSVLSDGATSQKRHIPGGFEMTDGQPDDSQLYVSSKRARLSLPTSFTPQLSQARSIASIASSVSSTTSTRYKWTGDFSQSGRARLSRSSSSVSGFSNVGLSQNQSQSQRSSQHSRPDPGESWARDSRERLQKLKEDNTRTDHFRLKANGIYLDHGPGSSATVIQARPTPSSRNAGDDRDTDLVRRSGAQSVLTKLRSLRGPPVAASPPHSRKPSLAPVSSSTSAVQKEPPAIKVAPPARQGPAIDQAIIILDSDDEEDAPVPVSTPAKQPSQYLAVHETPSRVRMHNQNPETTHPSTQTTIADDDDEVFAQVRRVMEAMDKDDDFLAEFSRT